MNHLSESSIEGKGLDGKFPLEMNCRENSAWTGFIPNEKAKRVFLKEAFLKKLNEKTFLKESFSKRSNASLPDDCSEEALPVSAWRVTLFLPNAKQSQATGLARELWQLIISH